MEIILQSKFLFPILCYQQKFYSVPFAVPFSGQLLLIKYWSTKVDVNKHFQMCLHIWLDVFFFFMMFPFFILFSLIPALVEMSYYNEHVFWNITERKKKSHKYLSTIQSSVPLCKLKSCMYLLQEYDCSSYWLKIVLQLKPVCIHA